MSSPVSPESIQPCCIGVGGSVCAPDSSLERNPTQRVSSLESFINRIIKNSEAPNRLCWWAHSDDVRDAYIRKLVKHHCGTSAGTDRDQLVWVALSLARQLKRMSVLEDCGKQASLSRRLFYDRDARRAAAYIAAYESGRSPIRCRLSVKKANQRAHEIRLIRNCTETVRYTPKLSSAGRERATFMFGCTRYTQQVLLSMICAAQRGPYKFDFAMPGRHGKEGAALAITRFINHYGCRFWVVADIKNAYPSISKPIIGHLFNLHKEVLRFIAMPIDEMERAYHDYHGKHVSRKEAQTKVPGFGLPQGGAHSAVVLSAVWKAILRFMPKGNAIAIPVYADNIAIGARSAEAARAAVFELRAAIQKFELSIGLQPGVLTLHEVEVCDAHAHRDHEDKPQSIGALNHVNSVDFVGYKISKDRVGNRMRYRPASRSWKKFYSNLYAEWDNLDLKDDDSMIQKAVKQWRWWQTGFPLWPVGRDKSWKSGREEDFRTRLFPHIDQYRLIRGYTSEPPFVGTWAALSLEMVKSKTASN